MTVEAFSPRRLTVGRQWRGWTKKALAEIVGKTPQMITSYEDGSAPPPDPVIERFSSVLGIPLAFFFAPELDEVPPEAISFRARRSMSSRVRDRTMAGGALAHDLISPAFRRRFQLPALDLPILSEHAPEHAAHLLREHWDLGQAPIGNMVHLLEVKAGVEVYWIDEDSPCIDAVSFWRQGRPYVLLNLSKPAGERGRFDAAHELGHLVLHRDVQTLDGRDVEQEANRFASALLLPKEQFLEECPKSVHLEGFWGMKRRWGASLQAMIRRGRDLGLFSDWQYESAFRRLSTLGWRTKEPHELDREGSLLHEKMFGRLYEKGTPSDRFAKEIGLGFDDLSELTPAARNHAASTKPREIRRGHLTLIVHPEGLGSN
jgi:Zn-dependent peptidase ImmA (M78 family)